MEGLRNVEQMLNSTSNINEKTPHPRYVGKKAEDKFDSSRSLNFTFSQYSLFFLHSHTYLRLQYLVDKFRRQIKFIFCWTYMSV